MNEWYHTLHKPSLSPPDWIFTPVWSILYSLMAISFYLMLQSKISTNKTSAMILFFIQLSLNLLWSPIFFEMQNILAAFVIICFLWLFVLLTTLSFYKHSKIAAWLMLPYFFWTTFAVYLNYGLLILNK